MYKALKAYTDYPFELLGDTAGKEAPVRECVVIKYDGNKYCDILVEGYITQIKACYIYRQEGRCGSVATFTYKELETLKYGEA